MPLTTYYLLRTTANHIPPHPIGCLSPNDRIQQETLPDGWPSLLLEQGTSGNNSEAGEASQPAQQAATSSDGGVAVSQAAATHEVIKASIDAPPHVRVGVRPHYTPPDRSGVPTTDEWALMCLAQKRKWLYGHYDGERKWQSGGKATTANCDAAHGIALEVARAEAVVTAPVGSEARDPDGNDVSTATTSLRSEVGVEGDAPAMPALEVAEKNVAWLGVAWCGVACRGLV